MAHPVRRLSLRAQLALFSAILVLVASGGSSLAGWRIVDGLMRQATSDRLNAAAQTFGALYQQRVSDVEIVTRQLTERAGLGFQITRRNTEQLQALIEPIQDLRPSYSIVVADANLVVMARLIPAGRFDPGASLLGAPGAAEALELGGAVTALVRREDCQLVVVVAVPVRNAQQAVIGLLYVRFPLDEDFVQRVKTDTGLELSIYCGDALVATTLPGRRAVMGSRADPEVVRHVLDAGQQWEEDLRLSGPTYRARYVPLLDIEGKPAGMYAVGIPVQTLRDARNAILRFFLPVMACIAALAMAIGYLGSAALTSPLRRLAAAAARIGSGDLESPVRAEGEDEVAQLGARMEEMRRSLFQTYTKLSELNRIKDEYLFSVAHEVRTPLASLVASVEVLAGDHDQMSAEETEATIRRIERGAVRLQTLVENVLDAGSIRAGRFTMYPSPVDLGQVVDGAVATLQPLLEEKRQRVDTDLAAHLPAVMADERRILQVLANLLSNASKYGPSHERITLSVVEEESRLLVKVSDRGPGVPLPEQGELFERYFRAANSAHSSPGAGLGLAISKAIIEAHGGAIGLESEPGQGSTVWFTLPLASQPERRSELLVQGARVGPVG